MDEMFGWFGGLVVFFWEQIHIDTWFGTVWFLSIELVIISVTV